jgi:predicted DCC family thiol-disulfide oxidoreductase YuxK
MQIASTFFYTALYKTTAQGNWLDGNPIFYLMNAPASGVVKHFLLKEWMAVHPGFCYAVGILIVCVEFLMPFLLFFPATRISAIYAGIFFHILLILTLDVPAIFFFLFPVQLMLLINPEHILRWIEGRRAYHAASPRPKLIYDGHCGFCRASVRGLKVMDLFNRIEYVDFQTHPDLSQIHPQLNNDVTKSQIYLVDIDSHSGNKRLHGGFFVFRRLGFMMPMLCPSILVFYFPGSGVIGPIVYRWVAQHRYLLHMNKTCTDNACYIGSI